jgi:mannosyltransferase OCH1-like enzyme
LTRGEKSKEKIPFRMGLNIESFKMNHLGLNYKLYENETMREFIEKLFDNNVLNAYDKILPLAYKADLGRYCLLYELGGVYSDLSNHFFQSIIYDQKKLHVFRDGFSAAPWITSNSIIAAPRKMELFEKIIAQIVDNTKNKYYGHTSL